MAAPDPLPGFAPIRGAPPGAIYEWRDERIAATLAHRVARAGAALVIDYGHAERATGDTLQAVRGHGFADPLVDPGEADLTAHVDFAALARTATRAGARLLGPVPQGEFLLRLGLAQRADRLRGQATPQQSTEINTAVTRLTAPDQMGTLFKALAIADPRLGVLPGFDWPEVTGPGSSQLAQTFF
jgi:SAM-dependent MidA family methyltransferase